jgi:hypothetical protein
MQGFGQSKARGLCPLDPRWSQELQTSFNLGSAPERGHMCGGDRRAAPLWSAAKRTGVWGRRPQRGPGAEPLAFLAQGPA